MIVHVDNEMVTIWRGGKPHKKFKKKYSKELPSIFAYQMGNTRGILKVLPTDF